MNSRYWLTIVRVCALLAVLASSALMMHYLAPAESGFCGPRSGCEAVRTSELGSFGNRFFNIPILGIVAYVVVFALTFMADRRAELKWVAGTGALLAIGLILHQALGVGSFCWLCVWVDGLAIAAGFAAAALAVSPRPQAEPLQVWPWWVFLPLSILIPIAWVQLKPNSAVPQVIAQFQKPNHLNVFEFSDFQCPHCRRLHPTLKQELQQLSGRPVYLRRFHVPLPAHELAEGAARADICAEAQGKEEQMADLLFEQPLSEGVWFDHAAKLGLDMAAFKQCLPADSTTERLADDVDLFKAARLRGLPATFVGRETITGAPAPEVVQEAFQKALAPAAFRISGLPFILSASALVVAVTVLGRRRATA